jgi:hypothetical protein
MPTGPSLNPQILGQAENAHGALLRRILRDTTLTFHDWIALNLIVAGVGDGHPDRIVQRLVDVLKIEHENADDIVAHLTATKLVKLGVAETGDAKLEASDLGQKTYLRVRRQVDKTVARLYTGIPGDDLATAGQVLTTITKRANAELARS